MNDLSLTRPLAIPPRAPALTHAHLSIGQVGLLVLFFCAPFSVSAIVQYAVPGVPTSVMVIMGSAFLLALHLLRIGRVRVDATVLLVVVTLFLPMAASFVVVPLNAVGTGIDYADYATSDLWSRMVNVLVYGVILVGGCTVLLELPEARRTVILRAYLAALGIFIFFGLWQWANFYLGVPFPNVRSRTHLHSVSASIASLFPGRLTSLATEPSFLAPLMIDAAILGAAVMGPTRRYLLLVLLPAAWVLLFSFSGGGYLNLAVVGGFALAVGAFDMVARRRLDRRVLAVLGAGAAAVLVLNQPLRQLFVPIVGRLGVLFDLEAHDRLYMVVMPFRWFLEDGVLAALFGHGPGSYALLRQMYRLPDGGPVHATSNNLFSDTLWEHGALGLAMVVALFLVLLVMGLRRRAESRAHMLGALLTVHLATSSIYRSDFMAPRFWVILLSIFVLYHSGAGGGRGRARQPLSRRGAEARPAANPVGTETVRANLW